MTRLSELRPYLALQNELWKGGAHPCVIAGGAPRDVDQGKQVKDVDLFIYTEPSTTNDILTILNALTQAVGTNFTDITNDDENYNRATAFRRGTIKRICEFNLEPFPLQVIFYTPGTQHREHIQNDPEGILEAYGRYVTDSFDLDICKTFLRADGTTYRSDDYLLAHSNRLISIPFDHHNRPMRTLERYRERVERLSQKYPDYQVRWEAPRSIPFRPRQMIIGDVIVTEDEIEDYRSSENPEGLYVNTVAGQISSRGGPLVARTYSSRQVQHDDEDASIARYFNTVPVSPRGVSGDTYVWGGDGRFGHVSAETGQIEWQGPNDGVSVPDLPEVDDEIPY